MKGNAFLFTFFSIDAPSNPADAAVLYARIARTHRSRTLSARPTRASVSAELHRFDLHGLEEGRNARGRGRLEGGSELLHLFLARVRLGLVRRAQLGPHLRGGVRVPLAVACLGILDGLLEDLLHVDGAIAEAVTRENHVLLACDAVGRLAKKGRTRDRARSRACVRDDDGCLRLSHPVRLALTNPH